MVGNCIDILGFGFPPCSCNYFFYNIIIILYNMKTKLFKLMATMFVAALSLGFTACGDDEDDPKKPGEEEVTIVGSWKYIDDDGYSILTFYANGKGQTYGWDADYPEDPEWIVRFSYYFDKDHMRLTVVPFEEENASGIYDADESETGTYSVIELSPERLIIRDLAHGDFATLVPYKGDVITSLYNNDEKKIK